MVLYPFSHKEATINITINIDYISALKKLHSANYQACSFPIIMANVTKSHKELAIGLYKLTEKSPNLVKRISSCYYKQNGEIEDIDIYRLTDAGFNFMNQISVAEKTLKEQFGDNALLTYPVEVTVPLSWLEEETE